jgi:hypothetical protein
MTAAFPRSVSKPAKLAPALRTPSTTCAVRLIDRRTGLTHRVNGSPLVIFTRNPSDAVADLLEGRDATVWEARVEPIGVPS